MSKDDLQVIIEDVLFEFVNSFDEPSHDAVVTWINKFPQFKEEIIDFAVSWGNMETLSGPLDIESIDADKFLLRGISIVQNLLHQNNEELQPISSLLFTAKLCGLMAVDFANEILLSVSMLGKIERCLLIFSSIPNDLIERIAIAVEQPAQAIILYLSTPPKLSNNLHYRTSDRPVTKTQEDFFDAIGKDPELSLKNREYWLSLKSQAGQL